MKLVKVLNIKGALLDKYQLENYLEKIASDHVLQENSAKETYPIPRLEENFRFITKTYEILNRHLKIGINIHPAGEWLLDNYYIIEEVVKTIEKELTLKKYTNFVGIANGAYHGFARIYVLATEIVAYTEASINANTLKDLLKAYQNKKTLNMEEIWNIGTFLQIAIVENIRNVCEKIYSVQMQKYRVENILERLVEYKTKQEQQYKISDENRNKITESGQMKYPFIEYMSYRLKRYGKKAYGYLNALEEQVMKMGTTVSEVIKKEHFDIAVRKVAIANSIKSIKELQRINFLEIFEEINGVEEILKKDPAGVYEAMDYKTKAYYRDKIKEISKKTKISELYITNKALELAIQKKNEVTQQEDISQIRKTHIGYYFIDKGMIDLYQSLQTNKKPHIPTTKKVGNYIAILVGLSFILAGIIFANIAKQTNLWIGLLIGILIYIPATQIVTEIVQYILNKIVKPTVIPKMDYAAGIPKEQATMVIIPTIIKDAKKVRDLFSKLEVFYLANQSDNLYFTLLGDVTSSDKEKEDTDLEIRQEGIKVVEELNKQYPTSGMGRFQFIYRNRIWYQTEQCYLGWERKRGLMNLFNEYLLGNIENPFETNTIEQERQKETIRYIITLDADTNLVLNSGLELIGAASHILNIPVLNQTKDVVIEGHGLIQPRVGIDLISTRKSLFTKIFAGAGGTDPYANAISDVYQDNFEEGIFTGKGIYDLQVFSTVLNKQIPENTVLSHDLLEGNYLRCALASDILLLDGYPYKYNAFMLRLHRWIRGDWQIIRWLRKKITNKENVKKQNPLNLLSKFKILDNLRRSLLEITIMLTIVAAAIIKVCYRITIWPIVTIALIATLMPMLLELIGYVTGKECGKSNHKFFIKTISGLKATLLRGILNLIFLPHKAYLSFNAISKTLYRVFVSKQHLLEWTTAEEAEANGKTDVISYYKMMFSNVVAGIVAIILIQRTQNTIFDIIFYAISMGWILAPAIACYISKEKIEKGKITQLNHNQIEYVLEIGKRTWDYFETYLNKENNYLPPDNYQEDRTRKIVDRTSSTNIGLGLLSVISAYDLGYISFEKAMTLLENILNTIMKLTKWNGHLYNWYHTKTLEPLIPKYISTVDSGNFVGYLYVVQEFFKQVIVNYQKNQEYQKVDIQVIKGFLQMVKDWIDKTDFGVLYDYEKRIFSIGFNVEENKLTDSYYDLLASEARQASLVAIAKQDIPSKHWQNLSRTLTAMNGYKGLVSWSGTAFEYLMPNVNIKKYPGSLLDESCKFMVMSQKEYAKKLGIPWGISESAFNLKDLNSNYQYKAFGIPWLGLKRGLADEMVVSSYGSILALPDEPREVVQNLKELEKVGMYDKYGFYEAIDYTPNRLANGKTSAVVKTYMAHHQALILLSINNLINYNILQERFMGNPQMKAVDILLQEKMPEDVILTKEKKEKIEKPKNIDYENYTEKVFTKMNERLNNYNVIANENYTICVNEKGEGFSKYKNILVNRFKGTNDYSEGITFYIKNIRTKRIWSTMYEKDMVKPDKYEVHFMPDKDKFVRNDENITSTYEIITAPDDPVEIRALELVNNGTMEETIEVTGMFEPVLSNKDQDYSHMAFNNLFLKYEYIEETNSILVKRNKRGETEPIYLAANLCTQNETVGELEYEIDEEKLNGGVGLRIPKMIENSIPFSKNLGLSVDPVVALKRTIKIKPNEKVTLNLILSVSEERQQVEENMKKYTNIENIKKAFAISRARIEEEARYLGIKGTDMEVYQKLLSYLIVQNPLKSLYLQNPTKDYSQQDLWKYGISGDLAMLLVKISDVNDVYVIKELLKAYEFFKVKNIPIDLVILDEEENVYERYVREAVEAEILNRHLQHVVNVPGGIYVLNGNEIEDKELLEFRANLVVDAHNGNLRMMLHDLEEEYLEKIPQVPKENTDKQNVVVDKKATILSDEILKYDNEYGGFSEDGKEYKIKITKNNKPIVTWSHVLANPNFGTVMTQNAGGYTWYRNSRLSRITEWTNNSLLDVPSEIIYLKDKETGNSWSLSANLNQDEEEYEITYGFGYAKYKQIRYGLLQELETFVPINDSIKVNLLRIKNTLPQKRELKLVYYIKPVLGEDGTKTNGFIDIKFDDNSNILFGENRYTSEVKAQHCYISSSDKIKSYTGSRKEFIGSGTIAKPEGLEHQRLDNQNSLGKSSCMAIEFSIELKAYEDKEIAIVLGSKEKKSEMQENAYYYTKIENCKKELENTKRYWSDLLRTLQVKTPVESMNIILNGWMVYQTIACRLWARSGFYQSGGAYGFRDQLQDTMGIKYINPEFMKEQVIRHASHQFIEGDVEHWWHEETQKGIRTKFSDDLLWMPYVTAEYIRYTGETQLLEIEVPYVKGDEIEEGQDESYAVHEPTQETETIYQHCIRAIDRGINLGEHGIPKIGSGDWNDGFSTVGNKGRGESIWLGFFLYEVLNRFIPICEMRQDTNKVTEYTKVQEALKRALNTEGWDGRWYRRAYMDDGKILGTIENEECKIDNIAQSWSVISNAGDNDKKYISMESLENHLLDRENGIMKLLDPAFEKSDLEPGYIKAYLPGVRENGGQYTHGAIWAIIAQAMLGFGDKAVEYFKIINPIEHARTREAVNKYKVEPYVVAADVYGVGNLTGRGGWTWYTGSSSWLYKAGVQYILGLEIKNKTLSVNPCISADWKEYSMRYQYKSSTYDIKVKNPEGNMTGVSKFLVNGEEIQEKEIKLIDNGKIYEIEVIM